MSQSTSKRRTWLWVTGLLTCCGTGSGFVLWAVLGGPDLQEELASGDAERMRAALAAADTEALKGKEGAATARVTVEAMKTMSMEDLASLWESDELSDEDRDKLEANMGAVWMNYMGQLADRFYAASEEEKERILDQQIDEFMEFKQRMEDYYEERKDDPEFKKRQEDRKHRWQTASKEDRKQRMMDTDPDRQMKMVNMWMQMARRARERGLDFGGRGDQDQGDKQEGSSRRRPKDRPAD
jgi:hypothetical protein